MNCCCWQKKVEFFPKPYFFEKTFFLKKKHQQISTEQKNCREMLKKLHEFVHYEVAPSK